MTKNQIASERAYRAYSSLQSAKNKDAQLPIYLGVVSVTLWKVKHGSLPPTHAEKQKLYV